MGIKRCPVAVTLLSVVISFLSSCGSAPSTRSESPGVRGTGVLCAPLKVAVLFDVTTSMTAARIAPPAVADVEPLLSRIASCGGEIAVGLIDEHPDAPLLRYHADPSPTPPAVTEKHGNAIAAAIQHNSEMADYEERRKGWEADNERQTSLAAFRSGLGAILERRMDARFSPVSIAVQRIGLFLSEPIRFNGSAPKKYCVLVTDGQDTTTAAPATLPSDISGVVVVNGSGSLGVLSVFHPARFESLRAAFAYVLQQEEPQ